MTQQNYDATLTTSKIGNIEIMTLGFGKNWVFGTNFDLFLQFILSCGEI